VLTARSDAIDGSRFAMAAGVVSMTEAEFELFYRRNARPLWAYFARVTGDAALADDLVQKTFFQFLRVRLDTTEELRLRSLLFRIGSNLVVDHWREAGRERRAMENQNPPPPPRDLDMREDVAKVFADLNPRERAMLWLAHVEGASHREIAEALSVREKSVKVLLYRARKRMAALMEKRGLREVAS